VIDAAVGLAVVPEPDSVLRVWLLVEGAGEGCDGIAPPTVAPFERAGFTVVEWGMITDSLTF
jgi:hypothetical protein